MKLKSTEIDAMNKLLNQKIPRIETRGIFTKYNLLTVNQVKDSVLIVLMFFLLLFHLRINHSDGYHVQNIADRTFNVEDMDRFV